VFVPETDTVPELISRPGLSDKYCPLLGWAVPETERPHKPEHACLQCWLFTPILVSGADALKQGGVLSLSAPHRRHRNSRSWNQPCKSITALIISASTALTATCQAFAQSQSLPSFSLDENLGDVARGPLGPWISAHSMKVSPA
jgi:hypothetical protein